MTEYAILYNPFSCSGKGEKLAHRLDEILAGRKFSYYDMTKIGDYRQFFSTLSPETAITVCGGDGTLNRFINEANPDEIPNDIYYFACGNGNDFLKDIGGKEGTEPVNINPYIKNLPTVTVKGKSYRFLNNVGFGIDGYCCQVGDEMRAANKEKINYTAIAIKGLLWGFKSVKATVTVDGVSSDFKHVWIAPTMKGRFYGGGMMPTPAQDRTAADRSLSLMLYHCPLKLKSLAVFPSIFSGKHINHTEMVDIKIGHSIKVVFDRPCPLQIDGETVLDVTEYEVKAN